MWAATPRLSRPPLHPQRAAIDVEQRLLTANANQLSHHLHVEPGTLRLGIDILDVVAECLALVFEALDALDQRTKPIGRNPAAGARRLVRLRPFRCLDRHRTPPRRARGDSGARAAMQPRGFQRNDQPWFGADAANAAFCSAVASF